MNSELIRKLAGTHTSIPVAILERVLRVENELYILQREETEEMQLHVATMDAIDRKRSQIQDNECTHDAETYYADSSNKSGGRHVCDICSREV